MAGICVRNLSTLLRNTTVTRSLCTSSIRCDKILDDSMNIATGLEKRELLAHAAGNTDPFNLKAMKRGKGTKDCPNEVPSACDSRIIGCICEEDATCINWMWLHKGQPRRCACGHWFKLVYKPPI